MTKLRSLGVTIALDDFGTGYSSLGYLQNLSLDALKIGRGSLTETENRQRGANGVAVCRGIGPHSWLRGIGEGVETTTQPDLLVSLGFDEIQGFLFGQAFVRSGRCQENVPELTLIKNYNIVFSVLK
jgi:EAL domain-containing protein (putative c-di-GMP-specific phosphodiesterase class I)